MSDWDLELARLRRAYLQAAPDRLDALVELIGRLRRDPADAGALADLRRAFHNLAGTGATYGFHEVSRLSSTAEEECRAFLGAGTPSPHDVDRWTDVAAGLREQLSGAGPPDASPAIARPERGDAVPTVLLVDDDKTFRAFLERQLTRQGIQVRIATTEAEARHALQAGLPDGMVVDVILPDGSGYEFVEHVRGLPGGGKVAAIVVSALTGLLDKVEAIRCGADAFFEKPLDERALVSKLQRLLRRRTTGQPRILSVEDDPDFAAFVRALLESAGYAVEGCADPRQFEQQLAAVKPDLVLMDVLLPEISGFDLGRVLRQNDAYATLPVLYLTTEQQPEARLRGLQSGGDDFLLKSDPPALLLATIAARLERARLLRDLVERDGLTRLLTHSAFAARVEAVASQFRRNPGRGAVLVMIDVDHFKSVNDRFGHPAGDLVLSSLAGLLSRRLRQSDIIGRYGGEEFGVVLQDVDEAVSARLMTRLLEEFAGIHHREAGGTTFQVTFSAGIAGLSETTADAQQWLAEADAALYAAKKEGRNRVCVRAGPGDRAGGP